MALAVILLISACSNSQPAVTNAPAPAASGPAIFQIKRQDGTQNPVTADMLKTLPLVKITAGGLPQEGVTVISVLRQAGVSDFVRVTIKGETGELVMNKGELLEDVIFDFANNGTIKLTSPRLPIPSPVRRVSVVQVE